MYTNRIDRFADWLCETRMGLVARLLVCAPIAFGVVYGLMFTFYVAL